LASRLRQRIRPVSPWRHGKAPHPLARVLDESTEVVNVEDALPLELRDFTRVALVGKDYAALNQRHFIPLEGRAILLGEVALQLALENAGVLKNFLDGRGVHDAVVLEPPLGIAADLAVPVFEIDEQMRSSSTITMSICRGIAPERMISRFGNAYHSGGRSRSLSTPVISRRCTPWPAILIFMW